MPEDSAGDRVRGERPSAQVAQLPPSDTPVANPADSGNAVVGVLAQTDPTGNDAAATDPTGDNPTGDIDTQAAALPADGGNFSGMTIAELLQLDLVLPQGGEGSEAVDQGVNNEPESVDLTELSLLELMNLRAAPAPQPNLPDLAPTDSKLQLNDTSLDEDQPSHLSPGELIPIGVLAGTDPRPEPPPPPPPPPPPGINVPPDALNVTKAGNEGSTIAITLMGVDADGLISSVKLASLPSNGTLFANAALTVPAVVGATYPTSGSGRVFYFVPAGDFNGTVTFQYTVVDNSGAPDTTPATATILVNAVNDAPVNAVPGGQSVNEDTSLTFSTGNGNAISISDVDAGSANVQVTLTVGNGALTLGSTAGVTVSGNGTGTVTVTGGLAAINTALNGLTFAPNANFHGSAGLTVTTNDLGNTGSGGAKSDTDTVTIVVNSIDDAPVNSVPGAQTVNEDSPLTFSTANGNAITVSDVDAVGIGVQVTLTATNGTLTLAGTSGLTVTGNGTDTVVITGRMSNINNALNGLVFQPTGDFNGSANLTITTNDQGNSGAGGPLSDTDSIAITVNAVNDAPVNTVPLATQTMNEDGTLTFSGGNGNAISIADVDAGGSSVQVTLAVTSGALTLAGTAGLAVSGNGTGTVTLTGSIAAINAALNGLVFAPPPDFNGSASLTITTNDQGNTGTGGPQTDVDSVAITINAVNDAPVNSVPGAQTVNEDGALTFSTGNGNAISIADVDAGSSNLQVTVAVTNGALTLAGTGGLAVSGNGTGSVTLTGSLAAINAALNGLVFAPAADFNGSANLLVTTNDLGHVGAGGALSDVDSVAITINPVNDAPAGADKTVATNEDTAYTFTTADFGFSDAKDSPSNALLAVHIDSLPGAGQLLLSGVAVTAGESVLASDIAAGKLTFTPDADANGSGYASFTFQVQDDGGTANGGVDLDPTPNTITVNVASVNDAPAGADNTVATDEDTAYSFTTADFGFSDAK
ncbi:MAG TPA: tandem-95 repeat protein, partial [Candidatus Acidoferrum sp.]|nr:tandem-95 repeat protein [Candidatus Acidoferrum sp.]